MSNLFITYIPDLSNQFILFCSLTYIFDNNLFYIILASIIFMGALICIKYSKIIKDVLK